MTTLLFDLDGTLTDPGLGITNSVMHALRRFGIEPPVREQLYPFIGPPLADSFRNFYGFSDADARLAVDYYREYYRDCGIFENALYPGVAEMLAALHAKNKRIMLATSKPEQFAEQILEHFAIHKFFDFVAGARMDETRTHKADVVAHALASTAADPNDCLMIGDREYDVLGSAAHGLKTIGVLYGYGSREELEAAGAWKIAATVDALQALLLTQ